MHEYGRLDSPAWCLYWHFGYQAHLWPLLSLGHCGVRQFAGSGRADGARCARLRDHAGEYGWLRSARCDVAGPASSEVGNRLEEHTSELQSLMRTSYAVLCLKKKNTMTYCH